VYRIQACSGIHQAFYKLDQQADCEATSAGYSCSVACHFEVKNAELRLPSSISAVSAPLVSTFGSFYSVIPKLGLLPIGMLLFLISFLSISWTVLV
jgi:hypothetical protein